MYYQGVESDLPDLLGVEEFSVRISAIKRQPTALADYKSGKRDYEYFKNEYNSDIADLTFFLDENVNIADVDKINVSFNPKLIEVSNFSCSGSK